MMVALNILFLAAATLVLYALFLALWVLVAAIFCPARKRLFGWASLPAFALLLAGYFQFQTRPAAVFARTFDFPPPADVTALRSSTFTLGDSGTTYLHFKAGPATVGRIVARGLQSGGAPSMTNQAPPSWWNPPANPPPANTYTAQFTGRNFASEEEVLITDPTTGDVWYRFIGID